MRKQKPRTERNAFLLLLSEIATRQVKQEIHEAKVTAKKESKQTVTGQTQAA